MRIDARKDPRVLAFRDGLEFSRRLLARESAFLDALRSKLKPDDAENVLLAFASAWQMVDIVHRIRELTYTLPGLSRDDPELLRFQQATVAAERLRNYVQHLRENLARPTNTAHVVWGLLVWANDEDPRSGYVYVSGSRRPAQLTFGSPAWYRQGQEWVPSIALTHEGETLQLKEAATLTVRFCEYLLDVIRGLQPDLPPFGPAASFAMRMELEGEPETEPKQRRAGAILVRVRQSHEE